MSTPYFCTRCQHQHVRGAIYTQHQGFKAPTFTEEEKVVLANVDRVVAAGDSGTNAGGLIPPTCTTTFDLCPTFPSECGKYNSTTCPPIMEVTIPTKEEVLAAVDAACQDAAIPLECQPTIVVKDHVEKWRGDTNEYENRIDFQKHSEFPDRAIEAVQHESMPAMKHGEPVKKKHWWQRRRE
jgi:hypothetical protein